MPPRLASAKISCDWGRKGPFRFSSHSFVSGGGGDAGAKETEQRLGEGKGNREDGDRKVETKMRKRTEIARLSFRLWVCARRDSSPGAV